MKRNVINVVSCGMVLLLTCTVSFANTDGGSQTEEFKYSTYRYYEEDTTYTPERVVGWKVVTFPCMVLLTPFTFPGYYIFTKEPEFKRSFKNYWRWIYYKVPYTVDDVKENTTPCVLTTGNKKVSQSYWT